MSWARASVLVWVSLGKGEWSMGGGKSPSNVTQTSKVEVSPEQQRLFDLALPNIESTIGAPPIAPDVLGFDPLQTQAQEQVVANAGQVQGLADASAASLQDFLNPNFLRPETNPALQAFIEAGARPLERQFQNVILPGIGSEAILAEGVGGSRQGVAEGLAAQGLTQGTKDVSAQITGNAFRDLLAAVSGARGQVGAAQGQQLAAPTALDVVGGARRGLEESQQQKDFLEQFLPFELSKDVLGIASTLPGSTAVTNVEGIAPSGPSPATAALAGAGTGASIGAAVGGPVGAGIGAALGALVGVLGS